MLRRASTATETTGSATTGGSEQQGSLGCAQGRPGTSGLRAHQRDDVTGHRPVQLRVPVGLDPQNPADALRAPRAHVPHRLSLVDRSRVHPHIRQPPGGGRVHLEHQTGERCLCVGESFLRLAAPGAAHGRHVERRGQVGHDGLQQRLDPAVAVGRAAQHHHALTGTGQVAQRGGQRRRGDRGAGAELLQRDRVEFRHRLLQQPAPPVRFFPQGFRHRALLDRVAAVRPDQRPHTQQIHHPGETVLGADRQLDDQRGRMQPLPDRLDRGVEVGTGAVQLVDEGDPRHPVPVGPPPHRLALRLYAGHGVEHRDRTVEDPQRALHLVGEVDMARRVDQVDPVAVPGAAHGRGEDGDPTIALLGVEVGDGGAVVDLTTLVGGPGEVQDPLGDGGLAGVDVGEDAQVADGGQRTGEVTVQVGTHDPWPFG